VVLVDRGDCRRRRSALFTGTRKRPEGARESRPGALIRRDRRPLTRRRCRRVWCSSEGSTTESVSGWQATVVMAEKAMARASCSEGFRSRAHRSERSGSNGKPEGIEGQAKAGRPPSSGVPPEVTSFARVSARAGDRGSQPRTRKRTKRVIRESSDSYGCSCRVVGCRSRNEASSWPGQSTPQGEPSLDEVA